MKEKILLKQHMGFGTHRVLPEGCGVRIEDGCVLCVYRMEPESWNGAGVPPAGTTCEVNGSASASGFVKCEILYSSADVVVFRRDRSPVERCSYSGDHTFRPVKTAEEIAAENKQKALDEMEVLGVGNPSRHDLLSALYDAGYRKQVQP